MTTRNGTFATFPLPQQYSDAGNTIGAEYGKLKDAVHNALQHPGSVKPNLCKSLSVLFDLRMSIVAKKSVSFKEQVELTELLYAKMLRLKDGTGLEHLLEAIRFSMRTYHRVMQNLAKKHAEPLPKRDKGQTFLVPNYEQFLAILGYLPQGEIFMEWVHGSLFIEFGFIAIDNLAQDLKPMPSNDALEELASLISEATQNFGASARQLGLWPKKTNGNPIEWPETISPEDLKEEHALAEAGFSDFAHHLQ